MFCSIERVIAPANAGPESRRSDVGKGTTITQLRRLGLSRAEVGYRGRRYCSD
jgi:hypothetical protein